VYPAALVPQVSRSLGRALLALGSLTVALGLAEGAYRWRMAASEAPDAGDDDWYRRYRAMNETIYRASADPEFVYEPVPGSSIDMEYGIAGFNGAGLREDHEITSAPIPGQVRVAVLGDSLVWSEYLAVHDALPQRTGEALGAGYEVLNAGVTGYATAEEARWYERAVRPLSPRVVVLVFCMNDLMIMSGPYGRFADAEERALKDAQDAMFAARAPVRRETIDDVLARREREAPLRLLSRALGLWERWRFESAYVDEYLILAEDEARIAAFGRALDRLGAAISSDGAIPLLVVSPVLERWEDYRWDGLHRIARQAGEHAGFTVIDPLAALRSRHDAAELRSGSDNLHYGRTGARVFGAILADAIRAAVEGR
jgi:lysophospholipase L1-like esterase